MKKLLLLAALTVAFVGCEDLSDMNQEPAQYVRADRHDAPPVKMLGTWADINNQHTPIVTVTETTLSMDLTAYNRGVVVIQLKDLYTAALGADHFSIEIGKKRFINLAFGTEGVYVHLLTLTIDKWCVRMQVYTPAPVTPDPEPQPEEPVKDPEPVNNIPTPM